MYWDTWDGPPRPGGSYATHPAHTVFHWIIFAVSVVDVLLQTYTLYLMLRVATKQLNEYRFFLAISAILDLCLAVSFGLLLQPIFHHPVLACWSAHGPLRLLGDQGARVGMIVSFAFGGLIVASQYYCLMFRIAAVLRDQTIRERFLSLPVIALFATFGVSIYAGGAFGAWLATYWQPGPFAELLREAAKREMLSRDEPSIACFNMHFGERRYASEYDNNKGYGSHVFALFIANCLFWQTFFVACAVWTIRYLGKNNDARSAKTRRMHLQYVRLLLLQMFCPFACILGPYGYMIFSSLLGHYLSIVAWYLCMMGFIAFPAVNAILTVLFVSPYRKRTVELLVMLVNAKRKDASVAMARVEHTEGSGLSLESNYGPMMQVSSRRLERTLVPVG